MAIKKVAFYTLGCKLNYAESETLSRLFTKENYELVDFETSADVYVINTCSVTEQANKKCKQIIHRAHRLNTNATIIVTGCYAQLKSEEIANFDGVDLVLGTNEKFNIIKRLNEIEQQKTADKIFSCDFRAISDFQHSYSLDGRTRSFLKIQDGCNYFCSYCTIPRARGKSRNPSIKELIENANNIAAQGIKEIIISGVNIGDFGKSTGEKFADLVRAFENETTIERYRISSIEPNLITDEIIDFIAQSKRFVPHFHIPLQSGSDHVLALMRRRYNTEMYRNKIEKIHSVMPDAAIGIDVIVGTPGETQEYFEECRTFLENLDFTHLHVFPYSPRENTDALKIEPKVSEKDKKERDIILHQLSDRKKHAYYERFIGKTVNVLFESRNDNGKIAGYSENYLRIETDFRPELQNQIVACQPLGFTDEGNLFTKIE